MTAYEGLMLFLQVFHALVVWYLACYVWFNLYKIWTANKKCSVCVQGRDPNSPPWKEPDRSNGKNPKIGLTVNQK